MTASFLNETVDQELQLSELSAVHGAWLAPVAATGAAFAAGWIAKELWDLTKEDIADAIHDFISDDKDSEDGNCSGYRQGGGSSGGGKYGKPVLK